MNPNSASPAPCDELEKIPTGEDCGTAGSIAHRPSRTPLNPTERHQVQEMALIQGLSNSEIGRRMGRDRGTIANVLKADDTAALREQLIGEQRAAALQTLRVNTARMATNWVNAADVASGKGDHRPSRDLLLHTGVIAPVIAERPTTVAVQVVLNGGPEPLSLAGGVVETVPYDRPVAWQATAEPTAAPAANGSPMPDDGGSRPTGRPSMRHQSLVATQNFPNPKHSPSETPDGCGIDLSVDLGGIE